ncbi:hypothetical protein BC941DRAFT_450086 [Chlamydoabsidia padenii]|nr:hypothetical protein BC941DRAFT_450086 [Chlamydoabsidia padenii]
MVTRKRASQVSITPRTSIIVKKNSIDPPSSTTLKPDQSPLPAEYSYQLIGISPSPSPDQVTPDTATKNLISTSTVAPLQQASPTTNSKGKAKDTTYQNTLQKPLINYELTRIQQSIGGANLEITDEELLLDGEDPHPELVKLIQEIEKKKEDRIKISMARRDAQLKSHQADFDSIVHKANMEFINGHNNLRKGLYADIFKRRLQLCSEHANSIIPEDSYVTPQRQINPLDQLGTDDYYSLAPSPYDLSYQDVNEDIGAIHTSIALDYAKVSQQNQ